MGEMMVMPGTQVLALVAVFLTVVLMAFALLSWALSGPDPVQRRLREIETASGGGSTQSREPHWSGTFLVRWVEPAGRLLLPREDLARSRLYRRLVQAGYRGPRALPIYLGAKVLLAAGLPVAGALAVAAWASWGALFQPLTALGLVGVAAAGFYLPAFFLQRRIEQRRSAFEEGFPDAMDMLVVCVEAGLGLDAAIQRVGEEMMHAHPVLATELRVMSLELRAGKTREAALRGLAERTGIDPVKSLTTLLIQAERFGTSVSAALREHASGMRHARIQRARERAAKLPVKMIFPILLFIFPALFLVVLGPAVIGIAESLLNAGG
ncbi:type II secretion system F family protein [Halorhodospira sp. 9622]|uniref:type II secretion system F family protein n=1 Tax=Halorhodospira sp. 9622 TaxID=2899136 RepID=UPI001EE803F4|nr:type II secretion system F family protein [Halorhodospira sp. 9622]MCG5538640.1 type II secretion system F family protein [Halorhodospira sp. 9622]